MAFFHVFARFRLCLEDFVAEGDEITDRRYVYHERGAGGPSMYFRRYFVAEGGEITGRKPAYYEQRAEGPCV